MKYVLDSVVVLRPELDTVHARAELFLDSFLGRTRSFPLSCMLSARVLILQTQITPRKSQFDRTQLPFAVFLSVSQTIVIQPKMKLTIAAILTTSAAAFAPAQQTGRASTSLNLNGWVADESKFCFGLPGALPPVGEFDPAGFAANADLGTIKKYREAELQHGRVGKFYVAFFLLMR